MEAWPSGALKALTALSVGPEECAGGTGHRNPLHSVVISPSHWDISLSLSLSLSLSVLEYLFSHMITVAVRRK
jgi:hypothetical protein